MYKILLVDDEPLILRGLATLIPWKDLSMEVVYKAKDGVDALNYIEKNEVDIIITDVKMPEMDGLTLIEKAKEQDPSLYFIILSAYEEFDYIKKGITLGIENYIVKPINQEELVRTLNKIVTKIESNVELIERNKNILRHNTLERWVDNNIALLELEERANLLGISIEQNWFVCFIVKPYKDISSTELIIKNHRRAIDHDHVFFENQDGNLVLILMDKGKSPSIKTLEEIGHSLLKLANNPLLISIGTVEKNADAIHKSYSFAAELLKKHYLYPNEMILSNLTLTSYKEVDRDFVTLLTSSEHHLEKVLTYIRDHKDAFQVNPHYYSMRLLSFLQQHRNLDVDMFYQYFSTLYECHTPDDVFHLIEEIIHHQVSNTPEDDHLPPIITHVLTFINDNYKEQLSLKYLASRFHINSNYLGQLFKKYIKQSFSDYLHQIRIQQAKVLLRESLYKTTEIGKLVGYNDVNYFYRVFKKYENVSPSEWRKNT